ncbi:MAG: carbohydrate kinase [Chitinophagaceae bacterium]|nr:MAG: carbohydrate kinase [Chitinophagaceae bacterium]
MKYTLGYDIGSSSVKAALLEVATGKTVASAFSPADEMPIAATRQGFAEQDPERWWKELIAATNTLRSQVNYNGNEVAGIGISYQMHGLVCVDKDGNVLRPSIIWCDSRAVDIGNKAFEELGHEYCLGKFLNSPGNFTASKLRWVKENEPELYNRIDKIMLPGDYIAMKLTGEVSTTISGLSEGIFWDFPAKSLAKDLLEYYGIDEDKIASLVPTFGEQGKVTQVAAGLLGLAPGTPVCYRAGDQPNNAWSLNVLNPGEVAATAGTSGVIYGVIDKINYDALSRVNNFVHVNHSDEHPRYGVLLCVNGTGSLNSWLRRNFFPGISYNQLNEEAARSPVGSDGVRFYPFGNGAERVLENRDPGACLQGVQFNRHDRTHIARAAQEGIVFALRYGMEVMQGMGLQMKTIRAGYANMFLSDVFATTFSNTTGCSIELYNTDGATGAARGAGVGCGIFNSMAESFGGMEVIKNIEPTTALLASNTEAYEYWKSGLTAYTI